MKIGKLKIKISLFTIILCVWLVILTCVLLVFYSKANDYLVHYEEVYQESLAVHAADSVFEHFSQYDVDYIWDHMDQKPRISKFEDEASVKKFMYNMLENKQMSYQPSGKYSDSVPTYVVEADGFVVAEFTLCKDLQNPREFGFPTWQINKINYYTESFETVNISAPSNFNVYVNGVLLDESYRCSDEVKPKDESYLLDYGTMPGIVEYYVADLYLKPEIKVTDMFDQEVELDYSEDKNLYETSYTGNHIERDELEEFAINYTITFANVISQDDKLENLEPYFPEGSTLYDSISRNTALLYFTSHTDTTIQNEEIKEFVAYSENVVYIEVYIEQKMTVDWSNVEVVPTTARLYCVKIDGEWKIVSMRF